jgi:NAD(P)-dependent dehydrogenase (short-subunit alcohol dehydrogenase family)
MDGKVVWVTGGSSGIGRAIVRAFAQAGATVAWNYINDPKGAREQSEWLEQNHYPVFSREFDVVSPEAVASFLSDVVRLYGSIHVLVNNAGIRADAVSWKMDLSDWQSVIDVNLTGPFLCTREVIPHMRKQQWGRIIFISSINGLRGKFGQGNYAASKAGLIGLTKSLARETGSFGVTVNAIAPGMVMTPMTQTLQSEWIDAAKKEAVLGILPEPNDVANAVLFLCSDQARCITGEVLRVDSGQYI